LRRCGDAADLRSFLIEKLGSTPGDVFCRAGISAAMRRKELITDERRTSSSRRITRAFPERIRDFGGDCFGRIRQKDIIVTPP